MMTLAEHIIEATPERIKRGETFVPAETPLPAERTEGSPFGSSMSWLASYLADVEHLPTATQIRSVGALSPGLDGLCAFSCPSVLQFAAQRGGGTDLAMEEDPAGG